MSRQQATVRIECCGLTDIGKKRETNEDQFLIADINKSFRVMDTSLGLDHQTRLFGESQGKLLIVADGMGGHAAGERASRIAVDSVVDYLLNVTPCVFHLDHAGGDDEFQDELKRALEHCHRTVRQEAADTPQQHGMGTTLTMVITMWPRAYVVHVGDSRCYLLRGGQINQLTNDHTIAQHFAKSGMGGEGANKSRWSNMLWNVIGGGDDGELAPEVHRVELEAGDQLILCTDGLTKHLSDENLLAAAQKASWAGSLCPELIRQANEAGGSDNVTVVVAAFVRGAQSSPEHDTVEFEVFPPVDRLRDTVDLEGDAPAPAGEGENL